MKPPVSSMTQLPAWKALQAHFPQISKRHLRDLFAEDSNRDDRLVIDSIGVDFDYAKHWVTNEAITLLVQLAKKTGLHNRITAIFRGDKINLTKNRAVLHVALRATKDQSIVVDGTEVMPQVQAVLYQMSEFSARMRNGEWKGYSNKLVRNIINIGIGGSDLGSVMAYEALRFYSQRDLTFSFVSNTAITSVTDTG